MLIATHMGYVVGNERMCCMTVMAEKTRLCIPLEARDFIGRGIRAGSVVQLIYIIGSDGQLSIPPGGH